METLTIEVEVPKEIYELGKGIGDFAASIKLALADGWDLGQDLPAIVTAALTNLVPAVQGLDKVTEEFSADKGAAVQALAVSLLPAVVDMVAPPAPPVA